MEFVRYESRNRTAFITLCRAEKRNAFSRETVTELKEAFGRAENDREIRAVILRAEGKAFSAGADLAYIQSLQNFSYEENAEDSAYLKDLYLQIYRLPKPVIAAVQGHALAGGCGLVTVCDFVLSVPEAKFGYTEVKIGFVPAIVTVFLLRKIGEAAAKSLLMTGDIVPAERMLQLGIVNQIIPAEQLDEETEKLAQKLAATTSGQAVAATKKLIADSYDKNMETALKDAADTNARARAFPDCKAGIQAFLDKKEIVW